MSKLTAPIKIKDLEDCEADRREGQRQAAKLWEEEKRAVGELRQIREAWEKEHGGGGKEEAPPALACMLLALKHIRKLKQESAQAYAELAKLTGKQRKPRPKF